MQQIDKHASILYSWITTFAGSCQYMANPHNIVK